MSISLETVAKVLLTAGLVQRFGFIKIGLIALALSLAAQVLIAFLNAYRKNQIKHQLSMYR